MTGKTAATAPAAPKPVPPSPSRPNSFPWPAIVVAAGLLLGVIAALSWKAEQGIAGPIAMAATDSQVAVLAPDRLYRLDANGVLLSIDETVVQADAADGALAFVNETLFVSPGVNGELLRCESENCNAFSGDPYAPTGPTSVHFDGSIYWLLETEADRLMRFDAAGKRIDMPVSDLSRPHSVHVADGHLYIANTGDAKLLKYTLHKRGVDQPETFTTYSAENGIDRPLRFVANGDGSFHAVFSNAGRTRGAVLRIAADGSAERLDIPDLVNPVDVARLGADLLVLDEARMQIFKVAADGSAELFGDEELTAELGADRTLRDVMAYFWPVCASLAVLLVGFGLSWLMFRRADPAAENEAIALKPDEEGILWLPVECELAPTRIPRHLSIVAPIALLPAAAIFMVGHPAIAGGWAAVLFLIAVAAPMRDASRTRLPRGERIGIRDRQLIVTHPELGRREFALPAVEWNPGELQPEPGQRIPLTRNGVDLYHRPTLETVLFPRLNLMRQINPAASPAREKPE